jgi:hypothetical protein
MGLVQRPAYSDRLQENRNHERYGIRSTVILACRKSKRTVYVFLYYLINTLILHYFHNVRAAEEAFTEKTSLVRTYEWSDIVI